MLLLSLKQLQLDRFFDVPRAGGAGASGMEAAFLRYSARKEGGTARAPPVVVGSSDDPDTSSIDDLLSDSEGSDYGSGCDASSDDDGGGFAFL